MIRDTVDFLYQELETHLLNKLGGTAYMQYTNMLDTAAGTDGSPVKAGRVGMSLINIEEERITKVQGAVKVGTLGKVNPEIKLNLYILFSVNSDLDADETKYLDSLQMLDEVIGFFQAKNVFTSENSPGLSADIGRLMLDLYSLPLEQHNYVWDSLGGQHLPSVMYKARVLYVQQAAPIGSSTPITEIDTNVGGK